MPALNLARAPAPPNTPRPAESPCSLNQLAKTSEHPSPHCSLLTRFPVRIRLVDSSHQFLRIMPPDKLLHCPAEQAAARDAHALGQAIHPLEQPCVD